MMTVTITSAPVLNDIVTVAALKEFLRVDHADEDTYITALRQVAITYVEAMTDTRLGDVTAMGYMDSFYPTRIPIGPVASISSVTYLSTANTLLTLDASKYYYDLQTKPARLQWVSPPDLYTDALNRVRVNMTVGYAEADIPTPLLQAVRLIVGHLYENRVEEVTGTITTRLKLGIDALVSPYRVLQ